MTFKHILSTFPWTSSHRVFRDPGLDLPEVLRSYLPAFMSLGTGLGIALHSLLYRFPFTQLNWPSSPFSSWDSKMLGRQLPSLTWNSADQLTIAYSGDKLDEIIPVAIAEDGEFCALLKYADFSKLCLFF